MSWKIEYTPLVRLVNYTGAAVIHIYFAFCGLFVAFCSDQPICNKKSRVRRQGFFNQEQLSRAAKGLTYCRSWPPNSPCRLFNAFVPLRQYSSCCSAFLPARFLITFSAPRRFISTQSNVLVLIFYHFLPYPSFDNSLRTSIIAPQAPRLK